MEYIHSESRRESVYFFQVLCGVQPDAFTGCHKQNTVAERERQIQFVRGDKNRFVLFVRQTAEKTEDKNPVRQVEVRSGFVQQNNWCLLRQGFGNQNPLFLSVRMGVEKGEIPFPTFPRRGRRKAYLLQGVIDNRFVFVSQTVQKRSIGIATERYDVMHGGVIHRESFGENEGSLSPTLPHREGVQTILAAQRRLKSGESAQEGGLTATVRSEHADHFALEEGEIQIGLYAVFCILYSVTDR